MTRSSQSTGSRTPVAAKRRRRRSPSDERRSLRRQIEHVEQQIEDVAHQRHDTWSANIGVPVELEIEGLSGQLEVLFDQKQKRKAGA